jgi:hypothetical protein
MNTASRLLAASILSFGLLGCAQMRSPEASPAAATSPARAADNQPEPIIMLVPVELSSRALEAGCWAQLYSERNFGGEVATLLGPVELQSLDKGTGRQLKRDIDSLVVGPKATLQVFQHQLFRDKTATFGPNAREGGLITKLGFGGRIESMRLSCMQ